ncbi:hypothetical protein Val02_22230 [Virgisporangium aliadipatigenens]|uniref:Tetratricopeptide repeat protein n=1 Tax=Virgisporangium aliadipatigenens TaxID=741659 RepID=A0A8J3YJB5_9ACTN|nr:hypothetical protein [Virgisporangium aliadipatigenens]GIJ45337.1 hypothetical protein Val02_22230 [Virgisporangium aliadipatigenens]
MSGRHDWFRNTSWDPGTAAGFEARLRRARPVNRPQYLRVQATHLLDAGDAATREAGLALLRRVLAEYPTDFEAKPASEQLGAGLARQGRLAEAETVLRDTLRLCAASPTGRSGTSGVPELRLAEVVLAGGDRSRLDEVAQLLRTAEADVQRLRPVRDVTYRFLLASARLAHRRGDPAAGDLAHRALAVAADAGRDRDAVGRVRASDEEIAELTGIRDTP